MFNQSRDMFNHGKDMTDVASSTTRDFNSDIFADTKYSRDPFGMTRDVSPKSRDSFGMPSSRDIGVVANTRDSFAVARQSFKKMDGDNDRRSSVASTLVRIQLACVKIFCEKFRLITMGQFVSAYGQNGTYRD